MTELSESPLLPTEQHLYDLYVTYVTGLQELRDKQREAMIADLRKDPYRDQSLFIERLEEEKKMHVVMARPEFVSWWRGLSSERKTELHALFGKPIAQLATEDRERIAKVFERHKFKKQPEGR